MSDLTQKKCIPCTSETSPLPKSQIERFKKQLNQDWKIIDSKKISRQFIFDSFTSAITFVNKIAAIAEAEDHHPDITINYKKVTLELTTHAIGGLSENDFIMAAKADKL